MLQTAGRTEKKSKGKKAAPHERYLEAYRWMLLARVLEDKLASLYRGGMITGGVYLGKGQEAVSVACGIFLQKGDVFAPLIRDQAGRSAFGEPLVDADMAIPVVTTAQLVVLSKRIRNIVLRYTSARNM